MKQYKIRVYSRGPAAYYVPAESAKVAMKIAQQKWPDNKPTLENHQNER